MRPGDYILSRHGKEVLRARIRYDPSQGTGREPTRYILSVDGAMPEAWIPDALVQVADMMRHKGGGAR